MAELWGDESGNDAYGIGFWTTCGIVVENVWCELIWPWFSMVLIMLIMFGATFGPIFFVIWWAGRKG